ncbi:gag/pol/env polyprotein, putative [Perkinsus marinus ATCC 50983]|uniref:Gag/pol/env polyprotein, putative n=1 Tax=Perkinsus marinus (strain ATCC 50983 / TXsc) TaxID=423536 RepID=C5LEJ8_PERM5|nr:gag/pol/env polyprotein, putative [Perkinsus marinus ATCC 50983]EER04816.1 gag/pol/env polyprotein, putative [Perkinsus marinus ATCC 50983]|eukprot:XP_002773000.1 gag/pol/env polyprotein, putative [Perkinsus marinus ATCC 50983]
MDEPTTEMVSCERPQGASPELLNYMDDCLAMFGLTVILLPSVLGELCSAMVEYVRLILLDADLHLKDPKTITFENKNFTVNGVYYHSPYVIGWPPERLRAVKDVILSAPVSYRQALEFLGILHVVACWLLPPWIILRKNCLQSLLQQRLHEDNAEWDDAIDDDCYPLLDEFMSSLQLPQLAQYNVFRRIICWAPLHIYCDASSYAYGYVVGQYYEEISANLNERQKEKLSAELATIHGDLAPRQDDTGRLFIPLWFRQALFSRVGQLTAHINTKEVLAATSAIVGVIWTVGNVHQARLEIYTDKATCLKVLRMWKPAPPGDSVVDVAQSIMQERLLQAVSSCVPEQHLRALRVHFVPGTSNPADSLTRDAFSEKIIMLMPPKKSIRQHQQQQVRQMLVPSFLKLSSSPPQPPDVLTAHPGILGRSLIAARLSSLWKLARILRAWHLASRKKGEEDVRLSDVNIRLGFQQWLCEKQGPLQIDQNDNRFLKIGLLWYQITLFSPAGDLIPQLVFPSLKDEEGILANLVWYLHHSTAHACPAIVLGLLRNYCVWQIQRRFVQDLLRSCDYCQRVARDRIRDYCGVRQIHTIPWYRVGLDVYGPVYKAARYDKQGRAPYNYVLSYTCYYTNKTILRPLHHCSGSEIAMVHKQVVADFGRMPYLSVDCGSEFMNQDFLSVTVEEGIEVRYDSPNSPWSRAPVERRHSVISKLLRVLAISGRSSEWHHHLDEATMAINSSSLLRGEPLLTPDMLFFSYRPCSSLSLWFSPFNDGAKSTNLQEQLKLRLIYDAQWMKNRETDRLEVDKRGHVPRLRSEVGDEVLVWVDSTGDKFKYSWRGPYTVMDYTDKGQVVLEGLKRPQAISNVKVYYRNTTIDGSLTNHMGDAPSKELRRLDGCFSQL